MSSSTVAAVDQSDTVLDVAYDVRPHHAVTVTMPKHLTLDQPYLSTIVLSASRSSSGSSIKEALAALPAPAIALDAADEPLAVVIDLDERAIAAEAYIK